MENLQTQECITEYEILPNSKDFSKVKVERFAFQSKLTVRIKFKLRDLHKRN